jgi:hypothetical protein
MLIGFILGEYNNGLRLYPGYHAIDLARINCTLKLHKRYTDFV